MSRRILSLIQTFRSGIGTQQLSNQIVSAKCYYYGVSPFHTCSRLWQKEQSHPRYKEESAKEEQGRQSESSSFDEKQHKEEEGRQSESSSFDEKQQKEEQGSKKEDDKSENEFKSKKSESDFSISLVPIDEFDRAESKTKISFHDMLDIFNRRTSPTGSEHVDFIYAALKHMKEFGVHRDLQTYKAILDVLPKGRYVPRNIFQAEYMHFPKHQQCIIDLLEQMEDNGVIPDWEMETMLINIFGRRAHPVKRYWRMMYWMPKFRNLSPWPLPSPITEDVFVLAKLAITRIMSVDVRSKITIFQTKDVENSIDDTWIVSGQSPVQQNLLENHPVDQPIYVEGGFRIYLREMPMLYFILRADPDKNRKIPIRDDYKADNVSELNFPFLVSAAASSDADFVNKPTVHEQEDGTIFAVCATGTSSKDSLLSWIRCLEKHGNPKLGKVPILFTFKSPIAATVSIENDEEEEDPKSIDRDKPSIES